MPYEKIEDLPEQVKNNLPEHGQEIFMKAFNNACGQYKNPQKRRGDKRESQEETAFKVAWNAVKQEYKKGDNGNWVKK